MTEERVRDVAHVGMVELLTPTLEESRRFFVDLMALTEVGRDGDSIHLHAWDDYELCTVKLTAAPLPGIGRTWLRAASPAALRRRVAAIEATGLGEGWAEGDPGLGPVYRFRDPDGHAIRAVQRRGPAAARARLEDDQLEPGRARQGAGVGPEDHRDLPHPRHAAGRRARPRWHRPGRRPGQAALSPFRQMERVPCRAVPVRPCSRNHAP